MLFQIIPPLVELFAVLSPSTGPEHTTIVSLVVIFWSRDKHRQHPKELRPSAVLSDPSSVAICILNPSFKCLSNISVPASARHSRCSNNRM